MLCETCYGDGEICAACDEPISHCDCTIEGGQEIDFCPACDGTGEAEWGLVPCWLCGGDGEVCTECGEALDVCGCPDSGPDITETCPECNGDGEIEP